MILILKNCKVRSAADVNFLATFINICCKIAILLAHNYNVCSVYSSLNEEHKIYYFQLLISFLIDQQQFLITTQFADNGTIQILQYLIWRGIALPQSCTPYFYLFITLLINEHKTLYFGKSRAHN